MVAADDTTTEPALDEPLCRPWKTAMHKKRWSLWAQNMDIDGSVPMTMMAYHALRMIHSAFIVISLCVQKNITFIYVLMLSLLDYDRKGDMIRVSLATVSICNGPLYIYKSIHPIKLQVIYLLKKDMSEPGTRDCSNA